MIDKTKTKLELNINVKNLKNGSGVKVWWRCDECFTYKLKQYRDCLRSSGLCSSCNGIKSATMMGNIYGKAQKKTGKCLYCELAIPSTNKTCEQHRKKHLTKIRSGSNNPMWTGKHVCICGARKSFGAKMCRDCSFLSGNRNGSNNGRYISKNRDEYLKLVRASKITRNMLNNVLKSLGKKKNNTTEKMLGYSIEDLKKHLEAQFQPGMTWDNYGKWHIDHVVPVKCFIEVGIKRPSVVNGLWNLRPLWAVENMKKSDKISNECSGILHAAFGKNDISKNTYKKLKKLLINTESN